VAGRWTYPLVAALPAWLAPLITCILMCPPSEWELQVLLLGWLSFVVFFF
jgi:hypothetical protein